MPRRPLKVGTYGNIKVTPVAGKTGTIYEARCRYRGFDGVTVRLSRRGLKKGEAKDALLTAISEKVTAAPAGTINRDSRMRDIAPQWLAEDIEYGIEVGTLAAKTLDDYRWALKKRILPRVGDLCVHELTVAACNRLIKDTRAELSLSAAATVRAVLSGLGDFLVRHDAATVNPVKGTQKLRRGRKETNKEVLVMTVEQIAEMLDGLEKFAQKKQRDEHGRSLGIRGRAWLDVPDLAIAELSTGARIGEILALTRESVGRKGEHVQVSIDHHLIRVTGQGLQREVRRKGGKPGIYPKVPEWSVPMWSRRKLAAAPGAPLFASFNGGWVDPSNTFSRLRAALDDCGFQWVTSHVWRHTVASMLDEAGLPVADIAAQLGNTRAVAERHYIADRSANDQAVEALEGMRKASEKRPNAG